MSEDRVMGVFWGNVMRKFYGEVLLGNFIG